MLNLTQSTKFLEQLEIVAIVFVLFYAYMPATTLGVILIFITWVLFVGWLKIWVKGTSGITETTALSKAQTFKIVFSWVGAILIIFSSFGICMYLFPEHFQNSQLFVQK